MVDVAAFRIGRPRNWISDTETFQTDAARQAFVVVVVAVVEFRLGLDTAVTFAAAVVVVVVGTAAAIVGTAAAGSTLLPMVCVCCCFGSTTSLLFARRLATSLTRELHFVA